MKKILIVIKNKKAVKCANTNTANKLPTSKMLLTIIQTRLIKLSVILVSGLLLNLNSSKKCLSCGSALDIEDFFFSNNCVVCSETQGYDTQWFENYDLNYYKGGFN